ncbi:MAG: hypothetical protein GC159_01225 [Phycisphaera sp.]|nr:hypothetical protein [Phycisphaera sp.]
MRPPASIRRHGCATLVAALICVCLAAPPLHAQSDNPFLDVIEGKSDKPKTPKDNPKDKPAADPAPKPAAKTVDLLALIDVNKNAVVGQWSRTDDGVAAQNVNRFAILEVPVDLTGGYEVRFEFTRASGDQTVGLIVPLGDKQCLLELSAWGGAAHGFARVNRAPTRSSDNPASFRPGTLQNNHRYVATVAVKRDGSDVTLAATLDGEPLIDWSGKITQVDPNLFIRTDSNKRLALAVGDSPVVYHTLTLVSGAGKTADAKPILAVKPPPGASIDPAAPDQSGQPAAPEAPMALLDPVRLDLKTLPWKELNGALKTADFKGEQVMWLKSEEGLALLPGVTMTDGVIECDIASKTFSGLAFRAEDVDNYDSVYLRPFNSGTPKHNNTVQYHSPGTPGCTWDALRRRFPGKYESGADVKVDAWFHLRVVIRGETVKAYVNDGKEPVLVVDKILSNRKSGKIGIWGWDTYFRNFRYTPAKAAP